MAGFRAVGFDLDGTFLSTHVDYSRLNSADLDVLRAHGIDPDSIDFGGAIKRPRAPILEWLKANGREGEFQGICDEMDAIFTEIETEYVEEARPFPGSRECIAAIKAKGLKVGILTRGSKTYAERALDVNGLKDSFDVIMGRDHSVYDNAKPSPMAMMEFADELEVLPEEILYIGDNVTDWQCAHGAGSHFVGVLSGSCKMEDWKKLDPGMIVIEHAGDVVHLL
jgi:phosphoglycolate phosphatase